jgi:hypothetical protein
MKPEGSIISMYMNSCHDSYPKPDEFSPDAPYFFQIHFRFIISQYILSLLMFVVNNSEYFVLNNAYHSNNTRRRNDLHLAQVTLSMYQKGVYYSGIKIFNALSKAIKDVSSKPNKFKIALKHFLLEHSFYTLNLFFDEY